MPLMPGPGSEFANFGDRDVLMGLTSDEAWLELTEQDLEVSCDNYCGKNIYTHTRFALIGIIILIGQILRYWLFLNMIGQSKIITESDKSD